MHLNKILFFLPEELKYLIKDDSRIFINLLLIGALTSIFIAGELFCLYFLGKALLGQSISALEEGFFISKYLESFSQAELLIFLGGFFALIIALRFISLVLFNYYSLRWTARVTARLQNSVMKAVLFSPVEVFDKRKLGGLIHGLMEATAGATLSIDAINALIMSFFATLMVFVTLAFISPWMILGAIIVGIPVFWGFAVPLQRKVRQLKNEYINARSPATEMATDVVNSIKDIKSLSVESQMVSEFSKKVEIAQSSSAKAKFIKKLPGPSLQAIFQLVFAFLIMFIGFVLPAEELAAHLPSVGVLGYGLFRVYPAITTLLRSQLEIHNALPELKVSARLVALPIDSLSEGSIEISKPFNEIRFEKVSFSYNSLKPVFENLNFSIRSGEITSFVGSSGAGKSTIIDLILKFRKPDRGTIWLQDSNLSEIVRTSWLDCLGIVRQDVFMFGGTIRANLKAWNSDATEADMLRACKQALALDFINNLPEGIDTIIGERGVTISGGQRQRLAIARAILKNPQVLILDEALSALDGETEAGVMNSLRTNFPNLTIILVSHRLASIEFSDRIIVFDKGSVIQEGNHSDLIKKDGRYKELFLTQINQDL